MSDPRVTDKVVGVAFAAFTSGKFAHPVQAMRSALEAAVPLLAPQPVVDREALDQTLSGHEVVWRGEIDERTQQCACGWMPDSWETDDQFDEEYREHRT